VRWQAIPCGRRGNTETRLGNGRCFKTLTGLSSEQLTEENARDDPAGGEVTASDLLSVDRNPMQPGAWREWIHSGLAQRLTASAFSIGDLLERSDRYHAPTLARVLIVAVDLEAGHGSGILNGAAQRAVQLFLASGS
jgi:hypothetical protein